MAGCTSALIDGILHTLCSDYLYIIKSPDFFIFMTALILSGILVWKGIRITTLPLFMLFLAVHISMFSILINTSMTNFAILDIGAAAHYRTVDTNNSTLTNLANTMITIYSYTIPVWIIILNFIFVIVYGLRFYFSRVFKSLI